MIKSWIGKNLSWGSGNRRQKGNTYQKKEMPWREESDFDGAIKLHLREGKVRC
jgi:hypothetical protein